MVLKIERINPAQAEKIRLLDEGQFADVKGRDIAPKKLSTHISAFANADGGDLYIGITDKERLWIGFTNVEDANGHLALFDSLFPLSTDFQYEFLECDGRKGLVLHIQINKTQGIVKASDGLPYIRRGAQSLPVNTPDKMKRLEFAKGVLSFETEPTNVAKEIITRFRRSENVHSGGCTHYSTRTVVSKANVNP